MKAKKKTVKKSAKSKAAKPAPVEFHNFTNADGDVLIVKIIDKNRQTHNNFKWPKVGESVECPDWKPHTGCGNGLHGWPWGFGIGEGRDFPLEGDIWIVFAAKPADVIGNIDGGAKCKAKNARIIYEGDMGGAMNFVKDGFAACVAAMTKGDDKDEASKLAASGSYSTLAASGSASKLAASGSYSTLAASGSASTLAASGSYSTLAASGSASTLAASGSYSTLAASGSDSTLAASGSASTLAASGSASTLAASGSASKLAASGSASKLAASGSYSTLAASGSDSTLAASGSDSTLAASGSYSTLAASGSDSICLAANGGVVSVGARGAFAIGYWDCSTGWQIMVGKVGVDGIKPHTKYRVENAKLVEA